MNEESRLQWETPQEYKKRVNAEDDELQGYVESNNLDTKSRNYLINFQAQKHDAEEDIGTPFNSSLEYQRYAENLAPDEDGNHFLPDPKGIYLQGELVSDEHRVFMGLDSEGKAILRKLSTNEDGTMQIEDSLADINDMYEALAQEQEASLVLLPQTVEAVMLKGEPESAANTERNSAMGEDEKPVVVASLETEPQHIPAAHEPSAAILSVAENARGSVATKEGELAQEDREALAGELSTLQADIDEQYAIIRNTEVSSEEHAQALHERDRIYGRAKDIAYQLAGKETLLATIKTNDAVALRAYRSSIPRNIKKTERELREAKLPKEVIEAHYGMLRQRRSFLRAFGNSGVEDRIALGLYGEFIRKANRLKELAAVLQSGRSDMLGSPEVTSVLEWHGIDTSDQEASSVLEQIRPIVEMYETAPSPEDGDKEPPQKRMRGEPARVWQARRGREGIVIPEHVYWDFLRRGDIDERMWAQNEITRRRLLNGEYAATPEQITKLKEHGLYKEGKLYSKIMADETLSHVLAARAAEAGAVAPTPEPVAGAELPPFAPPTGEDTVTPDDPQGVLPAAENVPAPASEPGSVLPDTAPVTLALPKNEPADQQQEPTAPVITVVSPAAENIPDEPIVMEEKETKPASIEPAPSAPSAPEKEYYGGGEFGVMGNEDVPLPEDAEDMLYKNLAAEIESLKRAYVATINIAEKRRIQREIDRLEEEAFNKEETMKRAVLQGETSGAAVQSPEAGADAGNTPKEPEKTEGKEDHRDIDFMVERRFVTRFGIDKSALEGVSGFTDLTMPQQLLVLRNLEQLAVTDVKQEARLRSKEEWGKKEWYKQLWKQVLSFGAQPELLTAKYEKELAKAQRGDKEGDPLHTKLLAQNLTYLEGLTKVAAAGPEVERKAGKLVINYVSRKDIFGSLEDKRLTPENLAAIERFNTVASEFAKYPHEWRYGNEQPGIFARFGTDRRSYEGLVDAYDNARKDMLAVFLEKFNEEGAENAEQRAMRVMNEVDERMQLNQLFNAHPDAETALQEIEGQNELWVGAREFLKSKGGFVAAGALARYKILVMTGGLALPLIGAIGASAGTGIGAVEGKRLMKERRAEGRMSEEDLREVVDYAVYKTEKTADGGKQRVLTDGEPVIERFEKRMLKEYTDATFFTDRMDRLSNKYRNTTDAKERAVLEWKIAQTLALMNEKLQRGMINFGGSSLEAGDAWKGDTIVNRLNFIQAMAKGEFDTSVDRDKLNEEIARIMQITGLRQDAVEDARKEEVKRVVYKSAAIRGTFAMVGAGLVEGGEKLVPWIRGFFHWGSGATATEATVHTAGGEQIAAATTKAVPPLSSGATEPVVPGGAAAPEAAAAPTGTPAPWEQILPPKPPHAPDAGIVDGDHAVNPLEHAAGGAGVHAGGAWENLAEADKLSTATNLAPRLLDHDVDQIFGRDALNRLTPEWLTVRNVPAAKFFPLNQYPSDAAGVEVNKIILSHGFIPENGYVPNEGETLEQFLYHSWIAKILREGPPQGMLTQVPDGQSLIDTAPQNAVHPSIRPGSGAPSTGELHANLARQPHVEERNFDGYGIHHHAQVLVDDKENVVRTLSESNKLNSLEIVEPTSREMAQYPELGKTLHMEERTFNGYGIVSKSRVVVDDQENIVRVLRRDVR